MKIKTSELKGVALDWIVATLEYPKATIKFRSIWLPSWQEEEEFPITAEFSTNWAQGGPIIDRELIATDYDHDVWNAAKYGLDWYCGGTTPLEAAMRCYVASKLGDEVEIPEELI